MTDTKSKSTTDANSKAGAKVTPAKEAQANNEATAAAEQIKADAMAEAETIIANAKAEADEIENDAKGEAGDIVADAQKDAQAIAQQAQRDRDDKSRGVVAEDANLQPFRNTTPRTNVFTTRGRCRPNETVMLTVEEGESHNGLDQCRKESE